MDGSPAVTLDDKYSAQDGRAFMSGTQALVRLALMQRRADAANGLDTAGFISGYRGSPLGIFDRALWAAAAHLDDHHVRFQPAINEDMAATAVWGTQQVGMYEAAKCDGVFAMWYGKGPGVDRSGDPLKHGNLAGTAPHGGVLVLMGDDHGAMSSTTAHQSEPAMMAALIPVLYPATVQEYLDFGLYGFALSRFSGCWVGFKCVGDIVESSASVTVDPGRARITLPEFDFPEGGVHIRWPDDAREQEERHMRFKLAAAQAFVRANGLDRVTHAGPVKRLGIVAAGKAWLDVRQALDELGLDAAAIQGLGIGVFKPALVWPLEPHAITEFARAYDDILVVEEKRGLIEEQLARILYALGPGERPGLLGKRDGAGNALVPEFGETDGVMVAEIIAKVIADQARRAGRESPLAGAASALEARTRESNRPSSDVARTVWFCAGCPHNISTRVPDGARAIAGIGCHTMAVSMDRNVVQYTHMGGEGGTWIGQAPFSTAGHMFQNMGDGTYFHSGIMGIRAACAAGVNVTFKIFHNDAVAMTGGQPVEGGLSPAEITHQLRAERVGRITVVTDEPGKYPAGTDWAKGVEIRHRSELDAVQRDLMGEPGVTAIIYDQTCAAEKRRRRKRGQMEDPPRRAVINERVCEGCGDCGLVSNCVAIKPLETEFGRKRAVDQSSCNKDFSCVDGFCPSFVTVEGGALRGADGAVGAGDFDPAQGLAPPVPARYPEGGVYNILLTGIGGTGVITTAQLLGMAAHLEAKGCTVLDMTGLAQKNGAVTSHIRIAGRQDAIGAPRLATGMADLILGFDMIVAAGGAALATMGAGRTRAVINDHLVPVAGFALEPDMALRPEAFTGVIADAIGGGDVDFIDATGLATALMGDAITANVFTVGYACQKGLLPLGIESLRRAIALNGVAVEANLRAFDWGRLAAADMAEVEARIGRTGEHSGDRPEDETLDTSLARRIAFLGAYQDGDYATVFESWVARVRAAEDEVLPGRTELTSAVIRNLFKLMAYKDEYEVARLFTDGAFEARLKREFTGDYKLRFHLAPPVFSRAHPVTGLPVKRTFGAWMMPAMRILAKFKFLRGTAFDPFGRSADRRAERQLIVDYQATLETILGALSPGNHAAAVALAAYPEMIRGYGHIKAESIRDADESRPDLIARFRGDAPAAVAAA